jgi:hypothetical protein
MILKIFGKLYYSLNAQKLAESKNIYKMANAATYWVEFQSLFTAIIYGGKLFTDKSKFIHYPQLSEIYIFSNVWMKYFAYLWVTFPRKLRPLRRFIKSTLCSDLQLLLLLLLWTAPCKGSDRVGRDERAPILRAKWGKTLPLKVPVRTCLTDGYRGQFFAEG